MAAAWETGSKVEITIPDVLRGDVPFEPASDRR